MKVNGHGFLFLSSPFLAVNLIVTKGIDISGEGFHSSRPEIFQFWGHSPRAFPGNNLTGVLARPGATCFENSDVVVIIGELYP